MNVPPFNVKRLLCTTPLRISLTATIALVGLIEIVHASSFGVAELPNPLPLTCTEPQMRGLPDFSQPPKGTAKYRFNGTCTSPQRPGNQLTYKLEGSWTPAETNSQKPNASESVEITGYEPFLPDRAPGGRIYMYWTARCNKDPWLHPTKANCQRFGAMIPEDLGVAAPDLQATSFPRTGHVITPGDRKRLLAEYNRLYPPDVAMPLDRERDRTAALVNPQQKKESATGAIAKPFVPGGTAPLAIMETPKIKKPASGDRIIQGQMVVQIDPPKVGGSPVTELEFTWLDTPPNRPRYINTFAVDTSKLIQGYPVDQAVTRGQTGRWELRARVSGKTPPGAWSLSTPFYLALTAPATTQSMTIPKPGTSILQSPPKVLEQQPPQLFRPPASSFQSPQGGSLYIRPRGIEGKEEDDPQLVPEKE